jgi:hypothetical protein
LSAGTEDELRIFVDELADEPRASDAIDFHMFAGNPLHLILLEGFMVSGIFQNQNAAVLGRDHIQSVGNDNRGRVRASTRHGLLT